MPSVATLTTFAAIVALFAAVPGPSNLYVVAQGLRAGRRPALLAAAGCACGAMTYVAATTLGLAAILASSATALSFLHYAGGAYLVWLGVRALRNGSDEAPDEPPPGRGGYVRQGLVVELSNPKVALFFLAFFPQFVHPGRGAAWSQILVLGALFCVVGLISDSLYALAAGSVGGRLRDSRRLRARAARAGGAMYLALGAWSIWSGTQASGTRGA